MYILQNKKSFILIGLPLLLIFVFLILTLITPSKPKIPDQPKPEITLAPTKYFSPPEPTSEHTSLPIEYSAQASQKMLKKLKERTPLSYPDQVAKYQLLSSVDFDSAVLVTSNMYRIEYIKSPDQFMVEILAQTITSAKQGARDWFIGKGFTRYVICDLPVVFYLNWNVAQQLRGQGVVFSPLADGC